MNRLKYLRMSRGNTQLEISKILGITRGAYTNIENGKREPDVETLSKLSDYFCTSIDFILCRPDGMYPSAKKEPATDEDDGLEGEARAIFDGLSAEKQAEGLRYLRYLAGNTDK